MDHLKRRTIKQIAGLAVSTTCAATAGVSSANEVAAFGTIAEQISHEGAELSTIDVYTRVSSTSNDIEVVIANSGIHPARITQLTPSHTVTNRGTFDFTRLMRNGDLTLAPGESAAVPITPHPFDVTNVSTNTQQRSETLSRTLRSSFSVVVDNDAFAKVRIADNLRWG